jgi:hypothetical protein
MQRTHKLVGVVADGARWGLPWLCALALSTGLAAAMTLAFAPAEREPGPSISTASGLAAPSMSGLADTPPIGYAEFADSNRRSCDTSGGRLLYVGLNTWINAEPPVGPCPP